MQYLGNMSRCWMLTALASRMIVALNYHNITDICPRTEIEESIHSCVYTCYYFDKTLSLLLLRPPSLPDLKVRPVQLIHIDPDLPTSTMVKGMVEYSELKNALLDILLDTKTVGDAEKANILSDLVARAHTIHSNMQMVREVSQTLHQAPTNPTISSVSTRNSNSPNHGATCGASGSQWTSTTTPFSQQSSKRAPLFLSPDSSARTVYTQPGKHSPLSGLYRKHSQVASTPSTHTRTS
jgi:hypothetical protein